MVSAFLKKPNCTNLLEFKEFKNILLPGMATYITDHIYAKMCLNCNTSTFLYPTHKID